MTFHAVTEHLHFLFCWLWNALDLGGIILWGALRTNFDGSLSMAYVWLMFPLFVFPPTFLLLGMHYEGHRSSHLSGLCRGTLRTNGSVSFYAITNSVSPCTFQSLLGDTL